MKTEKGVETGAGIGIIPWNNVYVMNSFNMKARQEWFWKSQNIILKATEKHKEREGNGETA